MQIDNHYRIVYDENNVMLQFFEQRERNKKDGSKETYEYTNDWYYPSIKIALLSYLNKVTIGSESAAELVKRIEHVEAKITELFSSFNNKINTLQ